MNQTQIAAVGLLFCLLASVAGCGNRNSASDNGVIQTRFPGQISAGGGTSGEVLSQAPRVASSGTPRGTPGIPEGAGGTTSGAALGGTSPGAAASQADPHPAPASPNAAGKPGSQ
jgi:hypothetical protein